MELRELEVTGKVCLWGWHAGAKACNVKTTYSRTSMVKEGGFTVTDDNLCSDCYKWLGMWKYGSSCLFSPISCILSLILYTCKCACFFPGEAWMSRILLLFIPVWFWWTAWSVVSFVANIIYCLASHFDAGFLLYTGSWYYRAKFTIICVSD